MLGTEGVVSAGVTSGSRAHPHTPQELLGQSWDHCGAIYHVLPTTAESWGALWETPPPIVFPPGSKGNLCQRKVPLSISLALTVPAAVMAAYYLLLQTYALRLEAILNAILLLFYAVELLLGVLALVSFSRYRSRATSCRELGNAGTRQKLAW